MISIQILRSIAAVMVILFHILLKAQILNLTEYSFLQGAAGVDLFFIISGFIMVYITDNKEFYFFDFIKKRLLRIIPLYWILSLTAALVYLYNPALVNSHNGETSILSSFSLLPIEGKAMLLEVGWTLRYEFIFYLIFSVSMSLFKNTVTACFILLGMVCMLPLIINDNFYTNYISNPIIIEFLFGMTAYFIYRKEILKSILLIVISCVILLFTSLFITQDTLQIRAIYYGLPMLLVFIAFIMIEPMIARRNEIFIQFIKYVGDASYSLYLSHLFTIGICAKLYVMFLHEIKNPLLFISTSMIASIFAGVLCYEIIEKPMYKIMRKNK